MNNITIKKGSYEISISLNKYKYIVGINSLEKLKILRLFEEFSNNLTLSEYAKENSSNVQMFFNEKEVKSKNVNILKVNTSFSLHQSLKMQSSSILLRSLNNRLSSNEFVEIYETINTLLESICQQFNEDSFIKIKTSNFSYNQFIKLIEPYIVVDELVINEYDLSLLDYILLQLDIIKYIVENNEMINIVIVDYPIIGSSILNSIKEINNCNFLIICDSISVFESIENYYIVDSSNFDVANPEDIYEKISVKILKNSNLLEGKLYMEKLLRKNKYSLNLLEDKL